MGHWYTQEGEAMHFIKGADGKMRDTTLRDARKHNLLPSVTEILNTIDKPALTNWKLKQVSRAAFDSGRETPVIEHLQDGSNYDDYHKSIMSLAFEQSTDARDRGSEIHAALEQLFMENGAFYSDYSDGVVEIAQEAANQIMEYTGQREFIPETTIAGVGYGGMVDLHNLEGEFVIDYKTKDIEEGKRNHWPEMAMQLAGYAHALEMPNARCLNVFIDRTTPGLVEIYEWPAEEIALGWEKFKLLRDYWQLSKQYKPEQA